MRGRQVPVAVFRLGRIVATANAMNRITNADILLGIQRHQAGDWGDVSAEEREASDGALVKGTKVRSVYHAANGTKFWVITQAGHTVTTILLPQDY